MVNRLGTVIEAGVEIGTEAVIENGIVAVLAIGTVAIVAIVIVVIAGTVIVIAAGTVTVVAAGTVTVVAAGTGIVTVIVVGNVIVMVIVIGVGVVVGVMANPGAVGVSATDLVLTLRANIMKTLTADVICYKCQGRGHMASGCPTSRSLTKDIEKITGKWYVNKPMAPKTIREVEEIKIQVPQEDSE